MFFVYNYSNTIMIIIFLVVVFFWRGKKKLPLMTSGMAEDPFPRETTIISGNYF